MPFSFSLSRVGRISWPAAGPATARSKTIQIVLAVFTRHLAPANRKNRVSVCASRRRYGESRKGRGHPPNGPSLQTSQKVQQVLLLGRGERSIALDDGIGLGSRQAPVLTTRVPFDRLDEVAGPAVVQEEQALTQAPQRRRSKFIRPRVALRDVVGQAGAHPMEQEVGIQQHRPLAQRRAGRPPCLQGRRVAERAADGFEELATAQTRRGWLRGLWRTEETHEVREPLDVAQPGQE